MVCLFGAVLITSCSNDTDPEESSQFFIENAQLAFETVNFEGIGDYQKPKIESGDHLVFVYQENENTSLTASGVLTMKGESVIPDNVIIIEVPATATETCTLNLSGLSANERDDIAIYRGVFDGVYIENLSFQATRIDASTWSVSFSAELSDQGNAFISIEDSGNYHKLEKD